MSRLFAYQVPNSIVSLDFFVGQRYHKSNAEVSKLYFIHNSIGHGFLRRTTKKDVNISQNFLVEDQMMAMQ